MNIRLSGKSETPTLEHLLSSCPKDLGDGCYRWHHNQVLKTVAESIATAINTNKGHHKPKIITFLSAGEKPYEQPRARSGLLTTATDWKLEVYLNKQLKFIARIK